MPSCPSPSTHYARSDPASASATGRPSWMMLFKAQIMPRVSPLCQMLRPKTTPAAPASVASWTTCSVSSTVSILGRRRSSRARGPRAPRWRRGCARGPSPRSTPCRRKPVVVRSSSVVISHVYYEKSRVVAGGGFEHVQHADVHENSFSPGIAETAPDALRGPRLLHDNRDERPDEGQVAFVDQFESVLPEDLILKIAEKPSAGGVGAVRSGPETHVAQAR